ncbi:hypothetical protein RRG08_051067 [Elysia crispata]|uniref:Uncharacterized protein n=1 Tax=Elysia crispata TaxID=231223 RepID=A0AAE1AXS3_9GAST|nr:hypothetical protein RRG08_051067 [Elysia crispata]
MRKSADSARVIWSFSCRKCPQTLPELSGASAVESVHRLCQSYLELQLVIWSSSCRKCPQTLPELSGASAVESGHRLCQSYLELQL